MLYFQSGCLYGGRLWKRKYSVMGSPKAHFMLHSATEHKIAVGKFRKSILAASMAVRQARIATSKQGTKRSISYIYMCILLYKVAR